MLNRLLAPLVLLALMAGCERDPGVATTLPAAPRTHGLSGYIAFVGAGARHSLWPLLRHSAAQHANLLGTIEVRYLEPQGGSTHEQIQLLRGLTDPAMRGLCVQVEDPVALSGVIADIQSRGVAVVAMVHPLPALSNVGFAGVNDEEIGTLLADTTARVLRGEGSIMVLHAGSEHPIYSPRLSAFDAEIRRHTRIDVFTRIDCQGDTLQARQIMRERSERYPRLSAWVSMGDWPTRGLSTERELGLPPGCQLITCGGAPQQWPLIRSGRCPAVVGADWNEVGAKAIQFCESAIRRPSGFQSRFLAPLQVIDARGLESYVAQWERAGAPASSVPAP